MDDSAVTPPAPDPAPVDRPRASRWSVPRLPVLIGVIGLGAVVTTGTWAKRRADAREQVEAQAIRQDASAALSALTDYRARCEALQWTAARFRTQAATTATEPLKSWTRERAMRFEAFVSEVDRSAELKRAERLKAEAEALCAKGELARAREQVRRMPVLKFPSAGQLAALRQQHYLEPLARFSRQNPAYYRAFQEHEPDAAAEDIASLKQQLSAVGVGAVTPQTMLGFELLSAVLPSEDPLLVDRATLASAGDYFEQPDSATLERWRRAQAAVRAQDWPTAVAQMQAIERTKVRTRQPFRAAYARAVLRNTPDRGGEVYAYMEEAARAGDKAARAWVSQEDVANGRWRAALPWLEARVADGEADAVAMLLKLYAQAPDGLPRDPEREAALLQKITATADAPPLSWMLLARFYASGEEGAANRKKAFGCYQRAAEQQHPPAWVELARCHLEGDGTSVNLDAARDCATKAFSAGERERAVPCLIELMKRAPERSADAIQTVLEMESVASPAGFNDVRTYGSGVAQLQTMLARYYDQRGLFGRAARLYTQSGSQDPDVLSRHAELTAVRACETCAGAGKTQSSVACPTCSGKGSVQCGECDGRGKLLIPGSPACSTCGGSGGMVQDGRAIACGTCNGTGKGKGSVIKQSCAACVAGRVPCRACTGGRILITKDCALCRGSGSRALAEGS